MYVVLEVLDERFALVADGDKRRFDRPKRKNLLHLQPLGIHSEVVANSLLETGRVTNAKLRFTIGNAQRMLEATESQKPIDPNSDTGVTTKARSQGDTTSVAGVTTEKRSQGDALSVALDAEEKGE